MLSRLDEPTGTPNLFIYGWNGDSKFKPNLIATVQSQTLVDAIILKDKESKGNGYIYLVCLGALLNYHIVDNPGTIA